MSVVMDSDTLIDLYTKPGSRVAAKIAIILEELGLSHRLHKVDASFDKNTLREISVNGHLPALTDIHPNGHKVSLNEPGAIAQYLVNTYDQGHRLSFPQHTPEEIEVNNWFFFSTSRVGPSHDEAVHFQQEAPQKIPYSIEHFRNKTIGLFFTLEQHLEKNKSGYLAGKKFTIADIAHLPFIAAADAAGIDLEMFPYLTSWYNKIITRPAVKKGLTAVGLDVP